jgi:hypothetical protein
MDSPAFTKAMVRSILLGLTALLSSCAGDRTAPPPALGTAGVRESIDRALPATLRDKRGWTNDIYAGFSELALAPTRESICAVVAVIEQESGLRVDPVVPNLAAIAWREIDDRASNAGVPPAIVHGVLALRSPDGRSFKERIDTAKTEKELSDIFEDFIATVPLGSTLFADHNPIRTRGPMQVHVVFAEQFAAARPYPYPIKVSIDDELFTRRGGLYFGIAHLLDYPAPYDAYLYRFADFNAGRYASRNAAFQAALGRASGTPITADGALLPHDASQGPGATELAARALAIRLKLSNHAVHEALLEGKSQEFEQTALYQRTFGLAEQTAGHALPRAVLPQIELHGPKISRKLTTAWYANRVDSRFHSCLNRRR